MEEFKRVYLQKCKELVLTPISDLMELLDTKIKSRSDLAVLHIPKRNRVEYGVGVEASQVFALMETVRETTYFRKIDFSFQNFGDDVAAIISKAIQSGVKIESLNLSGNEISSIGAAALCECLRQCDCIQELNLYGNPLSDDGVIFICQAIEKNRSLKILDLGNTDMGEKGFIALAIAMGLNSSIQTLGWDKPLLKTIQEQTSVALAKMLGTNNSLKHLSLGNHRLGDEGLHILLENGLTKNQALQTLNLKANKLTTHSSDNIRRLITDCGNLVEINLSCNQLTDNCAISLSDGLVFNTKLQSLDLRNCGFTDVGLVPLCDKLKVNRCIKKCLLWGNHFGVKTCQTFSSQNMMKQIQVDLQHYEVDGKSMLAFKEICC